MPEDLVRSVASGAWSEGATWSGGRVPSAGDRVQVRIGHDVVYDIESSEAIRIIHVAGTLRFATDRDTRLDVGLIRIETAEEWKEGGFNCHFTPDEAPDGAQRAALEVGTRPQPVEADHRALIRLVPFEGDDERSLPAIVCCGGRMDLHGAPLEHTWVKLKHSAAVGDKRLFLDRPVTGWRRGDRVVVTATTRQRPSAAMTPAHVTSRPQSEEGVIRGVDRYAYEKLRRMDAAASLDLEDPLGLHHRAEDGYAGEVANLSRNVVIESAEPDGIRGHTMYHRSSRGSISYAEFRHLGKEGVLGRYPIHFHLVEDTMRGSSVIGASIWDSDNRWVTIHGTEYLVVEDCIGYRSLGHGYYLENGTEVFNSLDRNLAIQALDAAKLEGQDLPFDRNDGAGFWWANSLNSFTRNVAVECDQYGFRFEAEESSGFDPELLVPQPDGSLEPIDVRTLPFIRFEGNEAHAQRRFGVNLGGIRGKTFNGFVFPQPHSVAGDVDGVGPDAQHPFVVSDLKVWDTHWCFHGASPSVIVDGMDLYDSQYGIWRSVISLHEYRDLSFEKIYTSPIYYPMGGYGPRIGLDGGRPSFPVLDPVDDLPPATVILGVDEVEGALRVHGRTIDNGAVARVVVNGHEAIDRRAEFAEWTAVVPESALEEGVLRAFATDRAGNVELRPHVLPLSRDRGPAADGGSASGSAAASGR
ncbi:MAG: G8 domain-containing protein [Planctomycetota bacterium]